MLVACNSKYPIADRWDALVKKRYSGDVSKPQNCHPDLVEGDIAVLDDAVIGHEQVETRVRGRCGRKSRVVANAHGAHARLVGGKNALFGRPIDPSLVGSGHYVNALEAAGPEGRAHHSARNAGYGSLKHAVLHLLGEDTPGAENEVYSDFRCQMDYA
jgi:hypothetical protein